MNLLQPADNQLRVATEQNNKLHALLEAQQIIFDDLAQSLQTTELLEQIKINEQMEENLNNSLSSSTSYLKSLLETPPNHDSGNDNDILQRILNDIQGQVIGLCQECVNNQMISAPITALIDIEQQMNGFEDKLEENNQFPETEDQKSKRMSLRETHFNKVMSFLGQTLHHNDSDSDSTDNTDTHT